SLLGDAVGPSHAFLRERTTLSAYGRVHWGDLDCDEPLPRDQSLVRLVDSAVDLLDANAPTGMWLGLGCAAGRRPYELAGRGAELTVGVDLSVSLLRAATQVLHRARFVFPVRRVGLVFDRREIRIPNVPVGAMTFWCCDVNNLPFADACFNGALSL